MKNESSLTLLVMLVSAAVIAVAGTAAPAKHAKPSKRYICPHGIHDVPLEPTRRNIMAGICVLP